MSFGANAADPHHFPDETTLRPGDPVLFDVGCRQDSYCSDMAYAAAEAFGRPDHDIEVIGITGTKGKSTVAYMLRAILDGEEPYEHTGILGSIETFDGIERGESHNTTPEAPDLWRHLANARDSGLGYMQDTRGDGF